MSKEVNQSKHMFSFMIIGLLLIAFNGKSVFSINGDKQIQIPSTPTFDNGGPTSTPWSPPTRPPICTSWNLSSEFRISPNQENPNRDLCNNLEVWQFMVSSGLTHIPLNYSLASYFTSSFNGFVDVNVWSNNSGLSWPLIGYNASNQTQLGSWLAHSINVHPSNNQLVIVAWKSALNGYVSISGGVADADVLCGGGIQWTIDRDAVTLASGSYANGGSQTFSSGTNGSGLNTVAVNENSMLYVIVDPNGDDLCDTTRVDLTINVTTTPTQTATITRTPTRTPTKTQTPNRTVTPTNAATSIWTETPIPVWYTGNSQTGVYGVKANISAPTQKPYFENVSYSGESNYVTIAEEYCIHTGWRYYEGWIWPWSYVEGKNPIDGYYVDDVSIHNWGRTKEYKIVWSTGTIWCAWVGSVKELCYSSWISPPAIVNAHSEIHSSSQNGLDTYFSEVYYMDSSNLWLLFNQTRWREDSPYSVDKIKNSEFKNYRP